MTPDTERDWLIRVSKSFSLLPVVVKIIVPPPSPALPKEKEKETEKTAIPPPPPKKKSAHKRKQPCKKPLTIPSSTMERLIRYKLREITSKSSKGNTEYSTRLINNVQNVIQFSVEWYIEDVLKKANQERESRKAKTMAVRDINKVVSDMNKAAESAKTS